MKITVLDRLCCNGVRLARYHFLDTSGLGRVWQMTTTNGQFLGLLWEHDLEEDRTWLHKPVKVA